MADAASRQDLGRRLTFAVTGASVGVALFLTAIKALGWLKGGSVALLASLADSGLDVVAAVASFIAVRVAAAPPDAEHRFGHGKAEAFSSLLQGGLVFATAALVAEEALRRLLSGRGAPAEDSALAVMTVSMVATGCLLMAQNYVLARARSLAVSGDRAHYAADLASNFAALLGVGLAKATGQPRYDAAAGLAVALWLIAGALRVFRDASDHLMDRELRGEERQAIVDCILSDERVKGVHELRTRAGGPMIYMQTHVDLEPFLSLAEAHEIVEAAERRLAERFPGADVLIHPDPLGYAEPTGPFGAESATAWRRRSRRARSRAGRAEAPLP